MQTVSLTQIEETIRKAQPAEQRRFLARLPYLLLSLDTFALLKTAEPSFKFWNNPEDAVYDDL